MAKTVLKLGEKLGTKHANKIIVISSTIKTILETKYKRHDSILIHNGVNTPTIATSSEYITSLGLQEKKYIIGVGRFVPEKGFHDLIDAFTQIRNPYYKLVLIGDADHETEYSRKIKTAAKTSGVILTGFIKGNKLNEVLSHARLFVMPSYHEGLPIALLEAMSYALDILASDIPANLEIKLNKYDYFHVGDTTSLLNALQNKLLSNTTRSSYDDIIRTYYNWELISQKTKEVYDNLL